MLRSLFLNQFPYLKLYFDFHQSDFMILAKCQTSPTRFIPPLKRTKLYFLFIYFVLSPDQRYKNFRFLLHLWFSLFDIAFDIFLSTFGFRFRISTKKKFLVASREDSLNQSGRRLPPVVVRPCSLLSAKKKPTFLNKRPRLLILWQLKRNCIIKIGKKL